MGLPQGNLGTVLKVYSMTRKTVVIPHGRRKGAMGAPTKASKPPQPFSSISQLFSELTTRLRLSTLHINNFSGSTIP